MALSETTGLGLMRKLCFLSTLVLLVLLCSRVSAQDYSNKGKDFWISYPEHINGTGSIMGLYITSDTNTTGTITINGANVPFTVTKNAIIPRFINLSGAGVNVIGTNNYIHLGNLQDGIKTNAAVHVTSLLPVVVYAHIINTARSGATLVLPTAVWGKEYIMPSYANSGGSGANQGYAELNVMASVPNTVVEITPTINSRNGARAAGVPFTVTLANPGDVYQLQFPQNTDPSGTKVRSVASGGSGCVPIAVVSATTWSAINCGSGNGGDNFYQQLFPYGSWGKKFITAPLKKVVANPGDLNVDIIRVYVKDPATVVTKMDNGTTITLAPLITPGNYYEYTAYNPTVIDADQPVQVMQYVTTQSCGTPQTQSDPEMIALSAIEQTISDITVYSAFASVVPGGNSAISTHYINVIMKSANTGTFTINGAAPTSTFNAIPGTNYSYLKQNIPTSGSPVSSLKADSGFVAIAYGFGNVESYGYNAGTNVRDLNQALEINNPYGNEQTPNICINTPFSFKVYLPDQSQTTPPVPIRYDSIRWDCSSPGVMIPNNFPYIAYGSPQVVPDSITIRNGKSVAWYSVPGNYIFNTPGVYTITVTVYRTSNDGCGNAQEYPFQLTVSEPPVATFNAVAPGCYLEQAVFTETTPQTPKATWLFWWNFGDPPSGASNISTVRNPTHLYTSAGVHTVRFMNITTAGCLSDTAQDVIDIPDIPDGTISGATNVCQNAPQPDITFTASGGKAPYTFTYTINGGAPQTIATTGTNTSVTLPVPTGTAGTYVYALTQVKNTGSNVCLRPLNQTTTVVVNPLPNAAISGATQVCVNAPPPVVTFTGSNATAPYTFTYTINGGAPQTVVSVGSTATVAVPTTAAGTFVYDLVSVQDASSTQCSQNQTGSVTVIVNPLPTATITGDITVCLNSPAPLVTFTGASGTAPYTFTYNINGGPNQTVVSAGSTATVSAPTTAAGTFVYNLVSVQDGSTTLCSQAQSGTVTVIVSPLPTGTIAGNITVCKDAAPPDITFTGANGTAPFTFTYTINGGPNQTITTISGNSVTLPVPTGTAGTFIYNLVSVQESSGAACIQNQTGSVTVVVKVLPTATVNGTITVCKNAPSPNITFTGSNGTAPYTFTYNINGGPALNVTTVSGNSVTVAVPTGTAGAFVYNLVNVQEGSGNACQQSQTGSATVIVNDLPTATVSGTTEVCRNGTPPLITFTGAGTTAPYTFTYNINGGAPQTITTTSGNSVTVSVPTGTAGTFVYNLVSVSDGTPQTCSQNQAGSATVVVNQLPTAAFNRTIPSCETRTISFTDISTPNSGILTTWAWDFGDPGSGGANTSTLQNPTHTFSTAGTYNVTLVVTTDKGCVSTNPPVPVTINVRPEAGFIVPEVCINDVATLFTDTSKISSGSFDPAGYYWDFGDPGSGAANFSTAQNGSHLYTAIGLYTVMHVVTSSFGCKDTVYNDIFINAADPVADFTVNNPTTLCANDSVGITNISTISQGSVTKLEIYWDFIGAPGVFQTINVPVFNGVYKHKYPTLTTTQTYTIRMIAYSGTICFSNKTIPITVNAAPAVRFNPMPNICYDAPPYQILPAIAAETGGVPGNGVFTGPGVSPGGLFNPVAAGIGTHRILYTYTATAGGCVDTASNLITVWDTASAQIGVQALLCERSPVSFNSANSTIPAGNGSINGWNWNFGDPSTGPSNTSTAAAPSHLFSSYGNYTVTLTVSTTNGCRSTIRSLPVTVNPIARPDFTFPPVSCLPNANVSFTNRSTIPLNTPASLSYLWNFGDPGSGAVNTSTGTNPSHTYAGTGPFNVKLQATSVEGCVHDTTIVLNSIHPQPVGSFRADKVDVCIGGSFTFTSTSNPLDGTITSWSWDLADGNTRTIPSFTYTYPAIGTYDVSHFIINSFGCKSSVATTTVSVNPYPVVDAGPRKYMLEGGAVELTPVLNIPYPVTYIWRPGRYLNDSTVSNPIARPPDDQYFTLIVTSYKGCSSSDTMFVKVLKMPGIPNIFSPNGDGIHDTWEIQYLDTYPGCTVDIVNRYGQLVYHSTGYPRPWDGKVNGKDAPVGTYYYVIDPKNGRKPVTGYVDIIR